jgi:F-type H+-transporting ATPase subunit b
MEHFPTFPAILLQVAGFFVLYVMLKTYFFGPIGHVLEDRERLVRERLDESEANRVKMVAARKEYEQRIAQIEDEARTKIQEAVKQAHEARDEMLAQAREQAEKLLEKARQEIDREREKAEVLVRDRVADLAILAAGKILEKNLDAAAHRHMIDDILNDVKA